MSSRDPLSDVGSFRLARFLRATAAKLLLALFRVRLIGAENIPSGGAVLSGNHVSYADPVLLWCAAPRPLHFMAKSELWQTGWLGWVLTRVWAFPVRRGEADRASIQTATELLKRGELVGIFPEGTRNQEGMGEAQQGAAFIAMRADAPIVPIGIDGTDRIKPKGRTMMRFPRVTMAIGEPVCAVDFTDLGRKQRVEAMTERVMEGVVRQLEVARTAR
ncbi:MAG: lysophospholipid acyltransferase family protein [Coriobacteriia bacterium]